MGFNFFSVIHLFLVDGVVLFLTFSQLFRWVWGVEVLPLYRPHLFGRLCQGEQHYLSFNYVLLYVCNIRDAEIRSLTGDSRLKKLKFIYERDAEKVRHKWSKSQQVIG